MKVNLSRSAKIHLQKGFPETPRYAPAQGDLIAAELSTG